MTNIPDIANRIIEVESKKQDLHSSSMIKIDITDILETDHEEFEEIEQKPEEFMVRLKLSYLDKIAPEKPQQPTNFVLTNLPKLLTKEIIKLSTEDNKKLRFFDGIIKKASETIKITTSRMFECPSCGVTISVRQLNNETTMPSKCSCGRKGFFKEINKEIRILQIFEIEDIISSENSTNLSCFLITDDLGENPLKKILGEKIRIIGIITDTPFFAKNKLVNDNLQPFYLDVNNIEVLEQSIGETQVTKEDEERIKAFARQDQTIILDKLASCVGRHIYGLEHIKKCMVLQQLGGSVNSERRNRMHILLLGDASTGKTSLMNSMSKLVPKFRKAVGGKTSTAGLVGGVNKEELTGRMTFERGSLSLANNGLHLIDELDKIDADVVASMNEVMEEGTITITKMGNRFTFPAQTSILASANPKNSDFDDTTELEKQIDINPTVLSRFDLVFLIRDIQTSEKIRGIGKKIFSKIKQEHEISDEFFKKYIVYSKNKHNPEWNETSSEIIINNYEQIRMNNRSKAIKIKTRHMEAMKRVAEALAKLRHSNLVEDQDANLSVELFKSYLREFGVEIIEQEIQEVARKPNKKLEMLEDVNSFFQNKKEPTHQELVDYLVSKGYSPIKAENEIIPNLMKNAEIIEFKKGFYKKI
jgi:replicative DNA helicase Mcm